MRDIATVLIGTIVMFFLCVAMVNGDFERPGTAVAIRWP